MTRRARIEDLADIRVPEQPAISPDGRRIVYVLRSDDLDRDRVVRALWEVDATSGPARRITNGSGDSAPAWAPDGSTLAFLRAAGGPAQIWLLPADGGEPVRLTDLPGGAGAPVWNRDGTRIAFAADVVAEDDGPTVADRLHYKTDGSRFGGDVRTQIHMVDIKTAATHQLTDAPWRAGIPAWAPDCDRLAFTAARSEDDRNGHVGIHLLDVGERGTPRSLRAIDTAGGVAVSVGWSRSGDALLVVGRPGPAPGHARLSSIPLDGSAPTELSAGLDRSVMPGAPGYPGAAPQPAEDGSVLFCARDRGHTHLYRSDPCGGAPRRLLGGAGRTVSALSISGDCAVLVVQTPTSFGEIVRLDLDLATGAEQVRTDHGDALSDVELYEPVEREFAIDDGAVVHGWLLRDPHTRGPGPALLDIHGGPHNAWSGSADAAHLYQQELVAGGWTVILLNPRGSDGYGEDFYRAAAGAWGTADAGDLLQPLDTLVAEGTIDPTRLAVAGYSYGGYMTCYLTGHDDRFAAAVTGGTISDLVSMVGTSDCGPWLAHHELGGAPWQQPDEYQAMSPITRIDRVSTPTLVLHGAEDHRCPVGQAEQWFTALRDRAVPTRFVRYPGASHQFPLTGVPSQRLDFNRRVADWVDQHIERTPMVSERPLTASHWDHRLTALAARHRVPGAVLGILRARPGHDDEMVEIPYGVLNAVTDVPTTTDSLFQIGSITKVWTTTVVMQLVDEGRLDLDAPVRDVLPELRLIDADTTRQLTMRHLLTHTSGIDGDVFNDTGRGADCVERYVEQLAAVTQLFPPGATWSYCNAGFVLAGRVIERICDDTWDRIVSDRLFHPLGLQHTVTLPEDALLHRVAVGHVDGDDGQPTRAPKWQLPRSIGPAGLITSCAADVLAFARMHLNGGVGPDGRRILSAASVEMMADKQVDLPDRHTAGDAWGLGWELATWDGQRVISHDGNTIGQAAFLQLVPTAGLAVVLLTNGGAGAELYRDMVGEIVTELTGASMPGLLEPSGSSSITVAGHVGRYERTGSQIDVFVRGGRSWLRRTATGPLADLVSERVRESELFAADESGDLFVTRYPHERHWTPVTFYALGPSERYLHQDGRATPMVEPPGDVRVEAQGGE